MNLKSPIDVVTNYNFKVYRNDVLRQEVNTHNVICDWFWVKRNGKTSSTEVWKCPLHVGNGTNVTPTSTDTALKSQLWGINCDNSATSYHLRESEDDVEWCQLTNKYTIPATASYVGTITECGLYGTNNKCLTTHALLLDAEGNPISIDKTDLDLIKIEVSLRFYFNDSEDIKVYPANQTPIWNNLYGGTHLAGRLNENIEALWCVKDALLGKDLHPMPVRSGSTPSWYSTYLSTVFARNIDTSNSTDRVLREINVQGARLGTDFAPTGQHFIRGFRVANMFIIPLPNEKIFPRYEIKAMEVGIGNGTTTEFVCPMNYFIEDTDKVYVDGILQVRGVDYTLEYDNNNQMLPELMASNDAIITGALDSDSSAANAYLPLFRAALTDLKITGTDAYGKNANAHSYVTHFSASQPILFDMEKEVKVNTFQIGKSHATKVTYTLWVSNDDGLTYTEVASITKTSRVVYKVTFDTITARYFKVTSTKDSLGFYKGCDSAGSYSAPEAVDKDELCLFGYVGHGIQFTNPPAAGAIITMDASTDLPMKNENFVFDVNMKLTY